MKAEQACSQGEAQACKRMGVAYWLGQGVPKDSRRAAPFLEKGCEAGFAEGCTSLGFLYLEGDGVPQDERRAAQLFAKACEGGDVEYGCFNLALRYLEGQGVPKDESRAASLLERSCKAGRPLACSLLGISYGTGRGVAKDESRAAQLFEQACGGGEAMGCYFLGRASLLGGGIAQDEQRAVKLFEKACEGGYFSACTELARSYRDGRGVSKDEQRAAELFKQACSAGESDACEQGRITAGSILIFSGQGMVPKYDNPALSSLWFNYSKEFATKLHEGLTRRGLPVQLFISTDPAQGGQAVVLSQLSKYPYEEAIQVSVAPEKEPTGTTFYLVVESFRLPSTPAAKGQRLATVQAGRFSKRYPIYRESGGDMRDAPPASLAEDFSELFRTSKPAR